MTPLSRQLTSRFVVDRVVYATITLMSVLIIYDGWHHLRLIDVVGVIVGPIVAMFMAHVFSAGLSERVERGRSLSNAERRRLVGDESRFLLLAAPPIAIVVVLDLVGIPLHDSITVVLWLAAASLGVWGGLAGRRAGFTGWRFGLMVLAGFTVGATVLLLQIVLQPSTPALNG